MISFRKRHTVCQCRAWKLRMLSSPASYGRRWSLLTLLMLFFTIMIFGHVIFLFRRSPVCGVWRCSQFATTETSARQGISVFHLCFIISPDIYTHSLKVYIVSGAIVKPSKEGGKQIRFDAKTKFEDCQEVLPEPALSAFNDLPVSCPNLRVLCTTLTYFVLHRSVEDVFR